MLTLDKYYQNKYIIIKLKNLPRTKRTHPWNTYAIPDDNYVTFVLNL